MLSTSDFIIAKIQGSVMIYSIYLPTVILLTLLVGRSLFKSGLHFMRKIFRENETLAKATNELFKIGFYLLNIGFALRIITVQFYENQINAQLIMEKLSIKIGGFSIYLGAVLLLHLFIFLRGVKHAKRNKREHEFIPAS